MQGPHAAASMVVLVTPSEQLAGQWVAHCLNLDVVTQGNSIEHAFEMAQEAILMAIADDLAEGLDPMERQPAPQSCWDFFVHVVQRGRPLESVQDKSAISAVVGMFKVAVPFAALPTHARPSILPEMMPPPWQIAALRDLRHSQRPHC
jgi:predicted RNase H-like HicB family nuclease